MRKKLLLVLLMIGGIFNMAAVSKAIKRSPEEQARQMQILQKRLQERAKSIEAQTNSGTASSEEIAAAQAKAARTRAAAEKLNGAIANETTNTLSEDKQSQ